MNLTGNTKAALINMNINMSLNDAFMRCIHPSLVNSLAGTCI